MLGIIITNTADLRKNAIIFFLLKYLGLQYQSASHMFLFMMTMGLKPRSMRDR